jgi:hypothetical protein
MPTEQTPIEKFQELVDDHDLTFDYSDDINMYRRGLAQLKEIKELAKELPIESVRAIWNNKVDRYLVENARAPFYWKD